MLPLADAVVLVSMIMMMVVSRRRCIRGTTGLWLRLSGWRSSVHAMVFVLVVRAIEFGVPPQQDGGLPRIRGNYGRLTAAIVAKGARDARLAALG